MPEQHLTNEIEDAIRSCLNTYRACEETINHCLRVGGKHAHLSLIRILTDCAEVCNTNASFLMRNSDLYMSTSSVAAEVCDGCAETCEQFEEDPQMTYCADECRKTADLCDRVSQQSLAA